MRPPAWRQAFHGSAQWWAGQDSPPQKGKTIVTHPKDQNGNPQEPLGPSTVNVLLAPYGPPVPFQHLMPANKYFLSTSQCKALTTFEAVKSGLHALERLVRSECAPLGDKQLLQPAVWLSVLRVTWSHWEHGSLKGRGCGCFCCFYSSSCSFTREVR